MSHLHLTLTLRGNMTPSIDKKVRTEIIPTLPLQWPIKNCFPASRCKDIGNRRPGWWPGWRKDHHRGLDRAVGHRVPGLVLLQHPHQAVNMDQAQGAWSCHSQETRGNVRWKVNIVCSSENHFDILGTIDEHYYSIPSNNFVLTSQPTLAPAPIPKYQHVRNPPIFPYSQNLAPSPVYRGIGAKKRVFVESDNGEFFGLNTTIFRTDGLLGGLYKKLANYYDDSAKVFICNL